RQVKHPIQLHDLTEYKHLVTNALKIKATPSAKILIEPKVPRKNTNLSTPRLITLTEKRTKMPRVKREAKRRRLIPNEHAILPGNVALNAKIGALREKWQCPTLGAGGRCGSTHCFVHPDEPDHFPLSHAHMESWGAAMLKGEEFATINKPPNNQLFDCLSPQALAAQSPLLRRRLELNKKDAVNSTPPQININVPL
ncbi:hypothetical protein B0H13DRAFT_1542013, partial [Mycena leptocephala]